MNEGGRRVSFIHLGCAKNQVDSEHMVASLALAGHSITADQEQADVLVINTCAFIGPAKRESVDRILEAEQWKAARKGRRLVVAGCLAERYAAELKQDIPAIDAMVGTGQLDRISQAVAGGRRLPLPGRRLPTLLPDHTAPRVLTTPPHMVYLKISEGCDHTCSFCIIPRLRGRHRSRTLESLAAEARGLAEQGARELALVAQDSTAYGLDLGYRDGLSRLVETLARIDGIEWIRVHYAYPTRLTRGFVSALADEPKLVPYLDIPFQHASRPVLQAMSRGGDGRSYLRLLAELRGRVPGLAVRSTFIVGFPNESARRFEELLRFLEQAELDHVGAFVYSHEEGTPAASRRDRVSEALKQERLQRLMQLQEGISRGKLQRFVGSEQLVMIDGPAPGGGSLARLATQAWDVDGHVRVECVASPGSMLRVRVTGADAHDLVASPAAA